MKRIATLSALAAGLAFSSPAPAFAQDAWTLQGKSCDEGPFAKPEEAELDALIECSKMWAAYRSDLEVVKDDYRRQVLTSFIRIWMEGDDRDARRAQRQLDQLGIPVTHLPPRPERDPDRETFAPPTPTAAATKRAEQHFRRGFQAYRKKNYAQALRHYQNMADAAPGYAKAHYNLACIQALLDDEAAMTESLYRLRDLAAADNEEAADFLKKTRTDADFHGIRDRSASFKRITGYAKILILNDLGEFGEENTDNLIDSLEKLGYKSKYQTADGDPLLRPYLLYAPHARVPAYLAYELISHPQLMTEQVGPERLCDEEDACYDVVLRWSDEVKGEPKRYVPDPRKAEKSLTQLERQQDAFLRKPDQTLNKVDRALDKPQEITDRIERNLNRPGQAIEKVEKTVDKIKGSVDKIQKLF